MNNNVTQEQIHIYFKRADLGGNCVRNDIWKQ